MIRALATEEIERVLRAEVVGRIGCHASGRTYVVPVAYAYEAGAIYAHSSIGQKVAMMRQNPAVCFEVDRVEDLVNWNSAICWGMYEELHDTDAERALELLRERLEHELPRVMEHGRLAAEEADGGDTPVVFRIKVTDMSGREERLHWELLPVSKNDGHAMAGSFQSTPAERWLTHERAQQLAEAAGVLDVEDIWTAADGLAQSRPLAEIVASFTYQRVEPALAERLATLLAELRDSLLAGHTSSTAAAIHSSGLSEWSDMIPEDVLAEHDAEDRAMVSLPAEGGVRD
jgi:nitroimidazol reductase NimA-like FMN-containing flavoprotein (pyridoxamine 5'-phosphate oxidase superfamily)